MSQQTCCYNACHRRCAIQASGHAEACCRHVPGWVHAQGTEYPPPPQLRKELVATVREVIGPIATPDVIHWAPGRVLSPIHASHRCLKGCADMLFVFCKHPSSNKEQGYTASRCQVWLRVAGLPKTRSGKIMRRILRKIASK